MREYQDTMDGLLDEDWDDNIINEHYAILNHRYQEDYPYEPMEDEEYAGETEDN